MKYSIMIPSKNGMPYLRFAVNSVLSQSYTDFELIVSVAEEEHEAVDFLKSVADLRLVTVHPLPGLSMTEHWDWVQYAARGEWQIFVGQDDGLQAGFFDLADELVSLAALHRTRVIASSRAYLHWPGSVFDRDGRGVVVRRVKNVAQIRSLQKDTLAALIGGKRYLELPQMYTTSLFHVSVITECRAAQGGDFLTCHPQDANLAALANGCEDRYLLSGVPLGWVGSSKKSAGLALSSLRGKKQVVGEGEQLLARSYLKSVDQSRHAYPAWAGDFSLGNLRIYLWQALRLTKQLQNRDFAERLESPTFITLLLAKCRTEAPKGHRGSLSEGLRLIAERNGVRLSSLYLLGTMFFFVEKFLRRAYSALRSIPRRSRVIAPKKFRTQWERVSAGEPWEGPFISGGIPLPRMKFSELRVKR